MITVAILGKLEQSIPKAFLQHLNAEAQIIGSGIKVIPLAVHKDHLVRSSKRRLVELQPAFIFACGEYLLQYGVFFSLFDYYFSHAPQAVGNTRILLVERTETLTATLARLKPTVMLHFPGGRRVPWHEVEVDLPLDPATTKAGIGDITQVISEYLRASLRPKSPPKPNAEQILDDWEEWLEEDCSTPDSAPVDLVLSNATRIELRYFRIDRIFSAESPAAAEPPLHSLIDQVLASPRKAFYQQTLEQSNPRPSLEVRPTPLVLIDSLPPLSTNFYAIAQAEEWGIDACQAHKRPGIFSIALITEEQEVGAPPRANARRGSEQESDEQDRLPDYSIPLEQKEYPHPLLEFKQIQLPTPDQLEYRLSLEHIAQQAEAIQAEQDEAQQHLSQLQCKTQLQDLHFGITAELLDKLNELERYIQQAQVLTPGQPSIGPTPTLLLLSFDEEIAKVYRRTRPDIERQLLLDLTPLRENHKNLANFDPAHYNSFAQGGTVAIPERCKKKISQALLWHRYRLESSLREVKVYQQDMAQWQAKIEQAQQQLSLLAGAYTRQYCTTLWQQHSEAIQQAQKEWLSAREAACFRLESGVRCRVLGQEGELVQLVIAALKQHQPEVEIDAGGIELQVAHELEGEEIAALQQEAAYLQQQADGQWADESTAFEQAYQHTLTQRNIANITRYITTIIGEIAGTQSDLIFLCESAEMLEKYQQVIAQRTGHRPCIFVIKAENLDDNLAAFAGAYRRIIPLFDLPGVQTAEQLKIGLAQVLID